MYNFAIEFKHVKHSPKYLYIIIFMFKIKLRN